LQCRGSEKTPTETVHPPGRAELLREPEGQTDTQLLESFVLRRDSVALEALVRRHATMVWGVCRRGLANHHDAEDARAPFVHESTGNLLAGSRDLGLFQEFWTFQRRGDRWLLHEVNPTRDDSLLKKPNGIAGLTEVELRNAERRVITL
jgi:hypothetical protein